LQRAVAARDPARVDPAAGTITLAAVAGTTLTRRRVLALGAAAGAGTLLAGTRAPALARGASGGPRSFGLTVGAADFQGRLSRVLRAPARFDVVGLRGARQGIEIRVRRRGGRWSRWVALAVHGDHAPDTGSGERASDPVWAGGADELQLRARRGVRGTLGLHFVSVGAARPLSSSAVGRAAAASQAQAQPGTPPPIIPRSAWGGDSVPPRVAPSYGEVQVAFVHHTVTANDYTADQSGSIVLAIAKYHRDTNGWNDLGYNFVVDQYGQVFEGRAGGVDQAVVGAHAQGYNGLSTGIALLGTYSDVPASEAALQAIAQLIGWKMSLHGVPVQGQITVVSGGGDLNRYKDGTPVTLERVSGHRDGDATECPGNALYAQLPDLRGRAQSFAGPVQPRAQATLAAVDRKVLYGEVAQFSGLVRQPDGTAAAGAPVAVQKRGRTSWVTIARAVTDAQGLWSAGAPWRATGDVRVKAAGITSGPETIVVVPKVQPRAITRRVVAGGAVAVSGRVRPSAPVVALVEKQGSDGRWRQVALERARVSRTTFRTTVTLRRAGLYRVTTKAGDKTASSAAQAMYVRAAHR
jgi:N-acetylmuramoyl-L-alanine amidase